MAEIVNLRQARKARRRAEKDASAAENRVRFGRTKTEARAQTRTRVVKTLELDGKKLDQGQGPATAPARRLRPKEPKAPS